MSARDRNQSMANRVADNLAGIIDAECNSACPEESMNRLMDGGGVIQGASFSNGTFLLQVKRPNGTYVLSMKTTGWHRLENQ